MSRRAANHAAKLARIDEEIEHANSIEEEASDEHSADAIIIDQ